jgi:uncharacterized protein YndB with AHSA1/START domain
MTEGSASIEINRDPATVFAAVADVTRIGEWSPECIGARWAAGATGPAVGAKFEGDNTFTVLGVTLKRWTTTSEVTACVPGQLFEFVAEGYTTWRYRIEPTATGSKVTESFEYAAHGPVQKLLYDTLMRRHSGMTKGMQQTLERIKASVESG